MLGFESSREPVRGEMALAIRQQLERIATKSYDEQDKKNIVLQNSTAKHKRI